jgi:hypothetical protein
MGQFIGTGTTVTFGTSGWTPELLDIRGPSYSREAVDMSHFGSTGGKIFSPGDLYDGGEITLELAFDPTDAPPLTGVAETITITYSDSSTTSWSVNGFLTGFEPGVPLEGRATASATFKVDGSINT